MRRYTEIPHIEILIALLASWIKRYQSDNNDETGSISLYTNMMLTFQIYLLVMVPKFPSEGATWASKAAYFGDGKFVLGGHWFGANSRETAN